MGNRYIKNSLETELTRLGVWDMPGFINGVLAEKKEELEKMNEEDRKRVIERLEKKGG